MKLIEYKDFEVPTAILAGSRCDEIVLNAHDFQYMCQLPPEALKELMMNLACKFRPVKEREYLRRNPNNEHR